MRRKMKRALAALVTVFMLFVGCGESNPNLECEEDLAKEQTQTASLVADELDGIGDTIEGALDIQKQGGLDRGQERLLRDAQGRARAAEQDLKDAFSVGCQ